MKAMIDMRKYAEKKDAEARDNYNKLCFLLNCIIPIIDELKETTQYKKQVKMYGNQLLKSIIPICNQHQKLFIEYGQAPNTDQNITMENVFNITSTAYEKALELFLQKPNAIVSIMAIVENMVAENPNYLNEVDVSYTPLDLDLK